MWNRWTCHDPRQTVETVRCVCLCVVWVCVSLRPVTTFDCRAAIEVFHTRRMQAYHFRLALLQSNHLTIIPQNGGLVSGSAKRCFVAHLHLTALISAYIYFWHPENNRNTHTEEKKLSKEFMYYICMNGNKSVLMLHSPSKLYKHREHSHECTCFVMAYPYRLVYIYIIIVAIRCLCVSVAETTGVDVISYRNASYELHDLTVLFLFRRRTMRLLLLLLCVCVRRDRGGWGLTRPTIRSPHSLRKRRGHSS